MENKDEINFVVLQKLCEIMGVDWQEVIKEHTEQQSWLDKQLKELDDDV